MCMCLISVLCGREPDLYYYRETEMSTSANITTHMDVPWRMPIYILCTFPNVRKQENAFLHRYTEEASQLLREGLR